MSVFTDAMAVGEARELLMARAVDGEDCPCCGRLAKVYKRRLTAASARALAAMYEEHGQEFGHLPSLAAKVLTDVAAQGGYLNLSAHWGLLEEENRKRHDGGRTGYWAVTALGEAWLAGRATVPMYALVFYGRCLGLEGQPVTAAEVLGTGFDFGRLMTARGRVAHEALAADGQGYMLLPATGEAA